MIRTRHHSSKSHGSSVRSKGGAVGSRHSSGRSAALKKGRNGSIISLTHGLPEDVPPPKPTKTAVQIETIKFIYSDEVTRAFKRKYKAYELGPPSASPRKSVDQSVEVTRLPELYSDFRAINKLLVSNQRFAEQLRQKLARTNTSDVDSESTAGHKRGVKLPRLTRKNSKQHIKVRQRRAESVGASIDDGAEHSTHRKVRHELAENASANNDSANGVSRIPKLPPIA